MIRFLVAALALVTLTLTSACAGPRYGDNDPVDWDGPPPWNYDIHGIDVARFQNDIDWARVAQSGIEFAFIKATEGGDRVDPKFARNWAGAGRAGIPRGAYHFYYFCTPPEVQARWFIRNVPREGGALPPVIDLEWNPYSPTCTTRPPGAEVRRQARVFMDILERHYGQRPIIYTTLEFYRQTGIGQLNEEFWLRSTAKTLRTTFPGQSWSFWQYTGTGVVPGVAGGVDINVFAGNSSTWRRWLQARTR
ncbi:GH25 family lysozyme [Roseovarius sp. SK2]|uniref:glycoside hydrolase family 25 protein n=1 Tax=Roseovarius TaxID=74030 RepID=UPI00237B9BF0|nr:GH25 family lysozyme [Roseovarius sp. SK2]MDD9724529.1 GH25 family lysozyme [Roseovarius sp. SK2]